MGRRGPPKKPTAMKELEGNPGKRPLPREPHYPEGNLRPPSHLRGEARREWLRVAPGLAQVGVYQSVDRAALSAYCSAWASYVRAEKECQKVGEWAIGVDGVARVAPWARVRQMSLEKLKQFAREFGFTPASRTEIVDPRDVPEAYQLGELRKKQEEWKAKKEARLKKAAKKDG